MFHVHVRRYILLLDGLFCIRLFITIGLYCRSSPLFCYLPSAWFFHPLLKMRYWKLLVFLCCYYSFQVCQCLFLVFKSSDVRWRYIYIFFFIISFWWIDPLLYNVLCLLWVFDWNYIVSNISMLPLLSFG